MNALFVILTVLIILAAILLMEKVTWGLVAFILVVSIVASFTTGSGNTAIDVTDQIENVAGDAQPAFPTAPVQQDAPTQDAPAN